MRIWSRIGRRPLFAGGNSNGDMQMLDFARRGRAAGSRCSCTTTTTPAAATHPYDKGAEQALAAASERGYTVVSVKRRLGDASSSIRRRE